MSDLFLKRRWIVGVILASLLLAGFQTTPRVLAAGANLVVTAVYWGASQNSGITAHPGDVNLPLTILLANAGDDFARAVEATLLVTRPFVYTYYVGEQKYTADSVTKTAGDLPPTGTFPLVFTLSIDATADEGIHRLTLKLQYKSARELSALQTEVNLDVPVWRGDLRILRVGTIPLKVYPGDTQVNLKVVIGNSGLGASKNLEVKLDLKEPFSPSSSGSDRLLIGILSPGMSFEANFFVDIAKNAKFGNYGVAALASSDSGAPIKIGEVPVFVSEKAAIQVISVSPESVNVGQAGAVIRILLKNVAKIEAESVRVQLKAGNFFSGTLTDFLGSLAPGETKTAFLTVDVDDEAVPGTYKMDLRLDWIQSQSALNETLSVQVVVTAQPLTILATSIVMIAVALGFMFVLVRRRRRARLAGTRTAPLQAQTTGNSKP